MKKSTALLLSFPLILSACATAPRPVQVIQVCPKVPLLELDAPARDWQQEMRLFLQGSLPTQPGLKPPSMPASPHTTK